MKTLLIILFAFSSISTKADEANSYSTKRVNCTRFEYKEKYIPGNKENPGYVVSDVKKIIIPCDSTISPSKTIKTKNFKQKNCAGKKTVGSLIGGGIAAALSATDAYGWSIPIGLVLGRGIANSDC